MAWLTETELEADAEELDRVAAETPHVDRFCSSSPWCLAAHRGLMGSRELAAWRGTGGWALMARRSERRLGELVEPLEALWGFCSPFVGASLADVVAESLEAFAARDDWRALLLAGTDLEGPVPDALAAARRPDWKLLIGGRTRRRRASLKGGYDGFLARRSRNFRDNLRRAGKRATAAGVALEHRTGGSEGDCAALLDRILAVEKRSWKGSQGLGIDLGRMAAFYAGMLPRLAARGGLRATLATRDGVDLAYHLGGVLGGTYRGLQHSYDEAVRDLSLGSLTHAYTVERVAIEGVTLYDLGQDTAYKARWSELVYDTHTLAVVRG